VLSFPGDFFCGLKMLSEDSGALHLRPLKLTLFYKYLGATHLLIPDEQLQRRITFIIMSLNNNSSIRCYSPFDIYWIAAELHNICSKKFFYQYQVQSTVIFYSINKYLQKIKAADNFGASVSRLAHKKYVHFFVLTQRNEPKKSQGFRIFWDSCFSTCSRDTTRSPA
jgi:hypothetical protein